jgi:hypothetical protein
VTVGESSDFPIIIRNTNTHPVVTHIDSLFLEYDDQNVKYEIVRACATSLLTDEEETQ